MRKPQTRYYPLLTINGKDIGMNVQLRKGTKYWRFLCNPDPWIDQPYIDEVFRYLCEADGIMYSLDRAFYDFRDFGMCMQGTLDPSAFWLSGKSLTLEHVEHILEKALPHWQNAGKIIENWLTGREITLEVLREMNKEFYDSKKYFKNHFQYADWAHERFLMRKKRK